MRRSLRGLVAWFVALALSACEVPVEDPALAPAGAALGSADQEIAARLYAGGPRTPAGFLVDAAPPGFVQVTTQHLKAEQLAAPAVLSHELCTDDWNEAFAWSEEVAAQATPYLDFVGNEATTRYFELDRVPRGQPDRYVRMRVFRCSYVDRRGVEPGAGFAGTLNQRPLDAAALRELSEYLWLFTTFNNAAHVVLASEARTGLVHAITIASLERAAGGVSCDRVLVRDWTHAADATTGALTLTTTIVREFRVRQEGAALVAC